MENFIFSNKHSDNYIKSLDVFVETFKNKGKSIKINTKNKKKSKQKSNTKNDKDEEEEDDDEDVKPTNKNNNVETDEDEEEPDEDEEEPDADIPEDDDDDNPVVENEDPDEEGFINYDEDDADDDDDDDEDDEDDEDDSVEGFKAKKKGKRKGKRSKKKSKGKRNNKGSRSEQPPDPIAIIIAKMGGTQNDITILKSVLGTFFHIFLAFYMSYSWYSNWYIDKPDPSIKEHFKWLQSNNIVDFLSQYAVLLIEKLHQMLFTIIPGGLNLAKSLSQGYLGNRFVFFTIFSACYSMVPKLIDFCKNILQNGYTRFVRIYAVFKSGAQSKVLIKKTIDELIIFATSISTIVLTSIMGVLYLTVYMENLVIDHTKDFTENVFSVIPAFFTKLVGGSLFYIIWLFLKFALLFTPSISIATFTITVLFLYYSFFRMDAPIKSMININNIINIVGNNGDKTSFITVLFNERPITDTFGKVINSFEKFVAWTTYMFPYLFFIFGMIKTLFSVFDIDNLYLFISVIVAIIVLIVTLVTVALDRFGFAKDVTEQVAQDARTFSFANLFGSNTPDDTPVGKTPMEILREQAKHILKQQQQQQQQQS